MATSLRLSNLPPIFSRTQFEFNRSRRNPNSLMASALPVEQREEKEKEAETEKIKGDSFIRFHLRKLSPYQPILPFEVLSTRLGRKPEDIVKLDANENPYGRKGKMKFSENFKIWDK